MVGYNGIVSAVVTEGSETSASFHYRKHTSENSRYEHLNSHHAGQHLALSTSRPFKCHCGLDSTKLYTLERHVRVASKHLTPDFPCTKCTAYQGINGFRRKDHLVQHMKFFHKYSDEQLADLFPSRRPTLRPAVRPCHFETCDYYRDTRPKELNTGEQGKRQFHKQSDYTMHMRKEHDWSPYPCPAEGCNKQRGEGYFSVSAFEKHYGEKHPEAEVTVRKL